MDAGNDLQDQIKRLITNMRKFCHHDDCRSPNACPQDPEHTRRHGLSCHDKLDLNTAIVWEAAALAIEVLEERMPPKMALRRIDGYAMVLRHHVEKYSTEASFIKELGRIMTKLLDTSYPDPFYRR